MSIFYNAEKRLFHLHTSDSTYVIGVYDEGYLLGLYYGERVTDSDFDAFTRRPPNASFSPANPVIGEYGFSPDTAPMEYGCSGAGDFRIAALSVRNPNGDSVTDIRYKTHRIYAGKREIPDLPSSYASDDETDTLEIDAVDAVSGVLVTLVYTVFRDLPVLTKRVIVRNPTEHLLVLDRVCSACFDFPTMDYDLLTLYGRHAAERTLERRPLSHGVQGVQSKRGASSHAQNPFAALAQHGAGEESGNVYGFNLVYSGNFIALAECDFNASTRFLMGINPQEFAWLLESGEMFYAPEVVSVFTPNGVGEMSRIFHRFYNAHMIRGRYKTEKRPLLINSWEAAYFDFDTEKLLAFADVAKELGIEMLVMDDGWFGARNDDRSSLGDWFVNENKLPGGLQRLVDGVHARGLKFGIWFEPEMISPDSDLFRAHPDWHVHVDARTPMLGRHQYVLDVSRKDVRDNIFRQMYAILHGSGIDYVKWDFNRNISDAGSALLPPERKQEFFHRFVLGTYDLMRRLTEAFPDILFEGCSGGGGRYDPAVLSFMPQIWASDNTDPIERLTIQFGTSMCYPASTMGAHVSACDRTGYKTKGNVALWGTFGYELDPRRLTQEDRKIVREQIRTYHATYDLIRSGDLYRLISPFENAHYAAWQFVSADRAETLFTLVCMRRKDGGTLYVKLRGLDPERTYTCIADGKTYTGAYLMRVGLNLTNAANTDGDSLLLRFV